MHWKTLHSKTILDTDYFRVRQDQCQKPNGEIVEKYYTIERGDAAVIAAFTDQRELVLIKQYRHPVESVNLELPAGYIDPNEKNMHQAAERELLEETGYKAKKIIKINDAFASAGSMNSKVHFFIGLNAEKIQKQDLDPHEEIEVVIKPWGKEIMDLVEKGEIKDMGSICGILFAEKYLQEND